MLEKLDWHTPVNCDFRNVIDLTHFLFGILNVQPWRKSVEYVYSKGVPNGKPNVGSETLV